MKSSRSPREVRVLCSFETGGASAAGDLLRRAVGQFVGLPPGEVRLSRSCPQCGSSEHGRPVVLPNGEAVMPAVSLSRAGRAVVVAISDLGPVGVDIERMEALRFAGFDDVALHARELAPTIEARATTWVRKESLLKATGDALHLDPRRIRLSDPDQPPQLIEWSAPHPPVRGVWMRDLDISRHAACVTVLSHGAPRITLKQVVLEGLPH